MAGSVSLAIRWLAWTLFYALAVDGFVVVVSLPSLQRWTDRMGEGLASAMFVLPAILASGIGYRFACWWWVLGPPLAIIPPYFALVAVARRRGVLARFVGDSPDVGTEGMAAILGLVVIVSGLIAMAAALGGVAFGKG